MKIIAIEKSSLIKLALMSRPIGQHHYSMLISTIQERYNFEIVPEVIKDMDAGLDFAHGFIGDTAIERLSLYNDGIVVQSKVPTAKLDFFLNDLIQWSIDELGFKMTSTHRADSLYESTLTVQSEVDIIGFQLKLDNIRRILKSSLKKISNIDVDFLPVGITISPDLNKVSGLKPAGFRVARRADTDFEANLYQSTAPLTTDLHLKLLEQLEANQPS
jgi:hypothetical protein